MIIGKAQSADGGFRRIPIRHTQIVDKDTRLRLIKYLDTLVYDKCLNSDWVGASDLFPVLPDDIMDTPLKIVYDKCYEKSNEDVQNIRINLSKYIGMLVREAVYYSDVRYYEQMAGSVRKYSLETKNLAENDYKLNRQKVIEHSILKSNE